MRAVWGIGVLTLMPFLMLAGPAEVRPVLDGKVYEERFAEGLKRCDEAALKIAGIEDIFEFYIQSVSPNSPAEKAGFKDGDLILEWDGAPMKSMQQSAPQLRPTDRTQPVKVMGLDGAVRTVSAPPGRLGVDTTRVSRSLEAQWMASAPRSPAWDREMLVAFKHVNIDPALAETALFHAFKKGLPKSSMTSAMAAACAFNQRRFADVKDFSAFSIGPDATGESWSVQSRRRRFWAAIATGDAIGAGSALSDDIEWIPNASEIPKLIEAFGGAPNSAEGLARDRIRDPLLLRASPTPGQPPFVRNILDNAIRFSHFQSPNMGADSAVAMVLEPAPAELELSVRFWTRLHSKTGGGRRPHFAIGVRAADTPDFRQRISMIDPQPIMGFCLQNRNELCVQHLIPDFRVCVPPETQMADFAQGKPHEFRMVICEGHAEMFLDGVSLACWPTTHLHKKFAPALSIGGMAFRIESFSVNELVRKGDLNASFYKDINKPYFGGRTRLHHAAWFNERKIVEELLAAGAKMDVLDQSQCTPVEFAAVNDNSEILKLMHEKGAPKQSVLAAAGYDTAEALDALLKQKPAEAKVVRMVSPLHLAAREGKLDAVKVLLAHGADVNAKASSHFSKCLPVAWAISEGKLDVVKALIEAGTDCGYRDETRRTALDYAEQTKQPAELIALIKKHTPAGEAPGSKPVKPPTPPTGDF